MPDIIYQIEAVNVPETVDHKLRSQEIEELPQFLRVIATSPGQLFLVNFGNLKPSADAAASPWVKVNPDGSPVGFFVNFNGNFIPVNPNALEVQNVDSPVIESGDVNLADIPANVLTDLGEVETFNTEFLSAPKVFLTLTSDSLESATTSNYRIIVAPSTTGFSVKVLNDGAIRALSFDWMALGNIQTPTV